MENKFLQVKKDNIFTKFINFFKKILYKSQSNISEQVMDIELEDTRNNFLDEIKLQHEENPNLINLQQRFENKEIELSSLTDEEVHNLNLLYKRQIENLEKVLENSKTELNIIKNRIKTYSTSM